MNRTPLRYPGGKSIMTPFFIDLIRVNGLQGVSYAEPYAGGAGTAINLLLDGQVRRIYINDANIAIFSFWKYAINESERFIDKIEKTCVDLQNWQYYHNFIKNAEQPSFELGFAAFFLSRTNRSGILTAGPIGGTSQEKQEKATYKIDCRFNKQDLISRIQRISMYKENIVVSNDDAIDFLKSLPADNNNLVYLDPPYFKQGKSLYFNYYNADDHRVLFDYLCNIVNFRWVLSYDNVNEIRELYKCFDLYELQLNYTAQSVKKGSELLTHSRNLIMPEELFIRRKNNNNIIIKKLNRNGIDSED